jgi:hypothetical protein
MSVLRRDDKIYDRYDGHKGVGRSYIPFNADKSRLQGAEPHKKAVFQIAFDLIARVCYSDQ